jgi:hypothetical protein
MDKDGLEFANKLLRVIVALLLRGKSDEALNLRQRVEFLSDLGLKPVEIAQILGRSNTYVNKELSGIRKARKKSDR